mmetsp:Transcript_109186/g.250508  ORF Transcript_109186/g.250508 Transcript_109186/m.250508 type:complete len:714 (-) Transcript_109186:11-2152(-)
MDRGQLHDCKLLCWRVTTYNAHAAPRVHRLHQLALHGAHKPPAAHSGIQKCRAVLIPRRGKTAGAGGPRGVTGCGACQVGSGAGLGSAGVEVTTVHFPAAPTLACDGHRLRARLIRTSLPGVAPIGAHMRTVDPRPATLLLAWRAVPRVALGLAPVLAVQLLPTRGAAGGPGHVAGHGADLLVAPKAGLHGELRALWTRTLVAIGVALMPACQLCPARSCAHWTFCAAQHRWRDTSSSARAGEGLAVDHAAGRAVSKVAKVLASVLPAGQRLAAHFSAQVVISTTVTLEETALCSAPVAAAGFQSLTNLRAYVVLLVRASNLPVLVPAAALLVHRGPARRAGSLMARRFAPVPAPEQRPAGAAAGGHWLLARGPLRGVVEGGRAAGAFLAPKRGVVPTATDDGPILIKMSAVPLMTRSLTPVHPTIQQLPTPVPTRKPPLPTGPVLDLAPAKARRLRLYHRTLLAGPGVARLLTAVLGAVQHLVAGLRAGPSGGEATLHNIVLRPAEARRQLPRRSTRRTRPRVAQLITGVLAPPVPTADLPAGVGLHVWAGLRVHLPAAEAPVFWLLVAGVHVRAVGAPPLQHPLAVGVGPLNPLLGAPQMEHSVAIAARPDGVLVDHPGQADHTVMLAAGQPRAQPLRQVPLPAADPGILRGLGRDSLHLRRAAVLALSALPLASVLVVVSLAPLLATLPTAVLPPIRLTIALPRPPLPSS